MGIDVRELRERVIRPCLKLFNENSESAENLLLGTAAQESLMGKHCVCERTGGLGLYRITAEKHREVWDKYLVQFPDLASLQRGLASQHQFLKDPHAELITNLCYSTGMAWIIYRQARVNFSKPTKLLTLANLWATHFDNGAGDVRRAEDFIQSYRNFGLANNKKLVA